MIAKHWIGIDNGVTGSIGIVSNEEEFKGDMHLTPVFSQQNYTKKKGNINRIDFNALTELLTPYSENAFIVLERPLVNPTRFKATISAIRSLEATLIIIEQLEIPFMYIDSKQWQKQMIGGGFKGPELKVASVDISSRLFPHLKDKIIKHKDGDGLLMAEYARRQQY